MLNKGPHISRNWAMHTWYTEADPTQYTSRIALCSGLIISHKTAILPTLFGLQASIAASEFVRQGIGVIVIPAIYAPTCRTISVRGGSAYPFF